MIRIQGLTKSYPGGNGLKGVSLHVLEGEVFAYLGPNGAGKTTTIRILTGLTSPTSGHAFLGGFHILDEPLRAKAQYGLVPQTFSLDRDLSITENLDIHCRLHGMGRARRRERIAAMLDYVGMADRGGELVKNLSGGLKRRLMIARALLHEPRILFLDEPTVGLDPKIRKKIWALIRQIKEDKKTVFLTTHYIEEAEFLADRVAFLDEGELVRLDTPANLMASLGQWALDETLHGEIKTVYFRERGEANAYAAAHAGAYTLRRVSLEDAFLQSTGKRCA